MLAWLALYHLHQTTTDIGSVTDSTCTNRVRYRKETKLDGVYDCGLNGVISVRLSMMRPVWLSIESPGSEY
jgi:hypothetical protein